MSEGKPGLPREDHESPEVRLGGARLASFGIKAASSANDAGPRKKTSESPQPISLAEGSLDQHLPRQGDV